MEIKTKYNLGDKVYVMHDNKVVYFTIQRINIKIGDKISIEYVSSEKFRQYLYLSKESDYMSLYVEEEKVFSTKEELLKSL